MKSPRTQCEPTAANSTGPEQINLALKPTPEEQTRRELLAAVERHQQAVARDPEYGWAWYQLGATLLDLGQPREAVPALEQAIELKAGPLGVHYLLGLALSDLGQVEAAKQQYEKVVAHDPQLLHSSSLIGLASMTNLALAQEQLGQPDEACQTLLPALREAVSILFNLAFLHFRAKRHELSLPYIHAAYLLRPNNGDIVHQYGATLNILKQSRAALPILKRAVELKPLCDSAWYDLGLAHAVLKHRRAARHCFIKSLEIDTRRKWSHYDLACLDALEGKREAAFQHLTLAVELGFRDTGYLQRDKDLRSLRRDARWKELIETMVRLENSKN